MKSCHTTSGSYSLCHSLVSRLSLLLTLPVMCVANFHYVSALLSTKLRILVRCSQMLPSHASANFRGLNKDQSGSKEFTGSWYRRVKTTTRGINVSKSGNADNSYSLVDNACLFTEVLEHMTPLCACLLLLDTFIGTLKFQALFFKYYSPCFSLNIEHFTLSLPLLKAIILFSC